MSIALARAIVVRESNWQSCVIFRDVVTLVVLLSPVHGLVPVVPVFAQLHPGFIVFRPVGAEVCARVAISCTTRKI